MYELQIVLSAATAAAATAGSNSASSSLLHRDIINEVTQELERLEACMRGKGGGGDTFYSNHNSDTQDGSLRNLMPTGGMSSPNYN